MQQERFDRCVMRAWIRATGKGTNFDEQVSEECTLDIGEPPPSAQSCTPSSERRDCSLRQVELTEKAWADSKWELIKSIGAAHQYLMLDKSSLFDGSSDMGLGRELFRIVIEDKRMRALFQKNFEHNMKACPQ